MYRSRNNPHHLRENYMESSIIIPVVVAIVMSIPGLYTAFVEMKKQRNSVIQISQDAALAIIKPLREEVDRLHKCITDLETELEAKEKRIAELEAMCGRVGILEKTIADREARIVELERLVAEKDAKISILQDEIDRLTERIEVVEKRRTRTIPPLKAD